MALAFRKVKRKLSVGKDAGKEMYFAMAKKTSMTPFEDVCELVSHNSSMSSADVKSILDSFNWVVSRELKAGRSLHLGELGHFRLTLCAKAQETAEEVTADKVTKARVVFFPGAILRDTCSKMTFVPYDEVIREVEKIVEVPVPCEQEHVA